MKYLIIFIVATCISTVASARNPIEKLEQQFPKSIGEFQLIKRTVVPAKTNRVAFDYKIPGRAQATVTITALHADRDSVDIDDDLTKPWRSTQSLSRQGLSQSFPICLAA